MSRLDDLLHDAHGALVDYVERIERASPEISLNWGHSIIRRLEREIRWRDMTSTPTDTED